SVYLALRLAGDHDLHGEKQYLARLQDAFQHRYGRAEAEWPETGRLALYLLGLRATCPPPEPGPQRLLVTWLKYYLEEDWAGSRQHGHPLTSYYQYSLGVLALCVHRKRVREEVIRRLLAAEHHGRFGHAGGSAVDTEAVAALAFACLERERTVGARLAAELRAAAHRVRRRMAEAQGRDGFFGNIYSTPWAMQVGVICGGGVSPGWGVGASRDVGAGISRVADARKRDGAAGGGVPRAAVSPAPTLRPDGACARRCLPPGRAQGGHCVGTPQLHVRGPACRGWGDPLGSLAVTPGLATCPAPVPWSHPGPHRLAPLAADLPQRRQCRTRTLTPPLPPTRFDTQDTPQGPFLSRVLGLEARQQKRSYWQLLTAPSTSLQMGIADYRPHDGETLILRLSKW
uniref:Transcobalamin-2 n=1 Tax=Accipiter nisus TaxID=211598 RepID=A0A8B9MT15_9AVES